MMALFVFCITWIASARTMTSNLQSNPLNHDLRSNSHAFLGSKWTTIGNEGCCVPITEIHQNKPLQRSTWNILSQSEISREPSTLDVDTPLQCQTSWPAACQCSDTYGLDLQFARSSLSPQEHRGGTSNSDACEDIVFQSAESSPLSISVSLMLSQEHNGGTTATRNATYTNKHTKQEHKRGTHNATTTTKSTLTTTWVASAQTITANSRAKNMNSDTSFGSSISPMSPIAFAEIHQKKWFHFPLQRSASNIVFQSRTSRGPSWQCNHAHGFNLPIAISASDVFLQVGPIHKHTKHDAEAALHPATQIITSTAKSRKFAHTTCSLFEATSSSNYIPFVHDIYYLGVPGFVDCDYGHRNMYYVAVFLSLITFIIHFRKQVKGSVVLIVCVAFTSCSASDIFIWCGGTSSNFLVSNGTMKAWGRNTYGNLGYGDTNHRGDSINEMGNYLPELDLGSNFFVTQVSASPVTTCALSSLNQVKCWGDNSVYGILGYGDKVNRWNAGTVPVVDVGFDVIQLAGGQEHRCAISDLNRVKCWGGNTYGQLGLGDTNKRGWGVNEMGNYLPEVDLGSNFNAILIEGEGHHACAVSSSNIVKKK
eukprot:1011392_1